MPQLLFRVGLDRTYIYDVLPALEKELAGRKSSASVSPGVPFLYERLLRQDDTQTFHPVFVRSKGRSNPYTLSLTSPQ